MTSLDHDLASLATATGERPHVVVLCGSLGSANRTARLGHHCAELCVRANATATVFTGDDLDLPFYRGGDDHPPAAVRLVKETARSDALVLVSPSYHGSISGLLKNALDYLNELLDAPHPLLDGRAVGCITLAGGPQGGASTLWAMRAIVHALRGWPTPLGVTFVPEHPTDDPTTHPHTRERLETMVGQLLAFAGGSAHVDAARMRAASG